MEKGKEGKKIISIDLEDDESENNTQVDTDRDLSVDADPEVNEDVNQLSTENLQSEKGISVTGNRKNKKISRALKDILTSNSTKFMNNFDPELSNRERRKLTRKFNSDGKKNATGFDDNGVLGGVDKDVCDCLVEDCPGCHFPCPKCRSCKCGLECRVNRKWMYEAIENETDLKVPRNSNISNN